MLIINVNYQHSAPFPLPRSEAKACALKKTIYAVVFGLRLLIFSPVKSSE